MNYLIRIAIIVITYGFIYRQVFVEHKLHDLPGLFTSIMEQREGIVMIVLVLLMMLVNWGIETAKWNLLITKIETLSFLKAFRAVMTGVSVSLFTPNRTGDYLGRVFILDKGNHVEGILLTLIGSFAQIVVTLSIGLFSLLAYLNRYVVLESQIQQYLMSSLVVIVPCVVFVVILLYFNINILSDFMVRYLPRQWDQFRHYVMVFSKFSHTELFRVLLLSLLRYFVFSSQFFLLLWVFGAELPVMQGMIMIPVIYLVMAVVPSMALTELGIRGSVSVFIIGTYFERFAPGSGKIELAVLTAATLIWIINLIIPAILGTFFVFSLKFFRR